MKRNRISNRIISKAGVRWIRRTLSLLLILNLLMNSLAFAVTPDMAALSPEEQAAIELSTRSKALIGRKVAAENIVTFWLGDREPMLMSDLLEEAGLPVTLDEVAQAMAFDISGEMPAEEILALEPVDTDYLVVPLKSFDEIGVAVRTADTAYIIRLTEGIATGSPVQEQETFELGGDDAEAEIPDVDAPYSAVLGAGEVKLSALLAAADLPVKAKSVEMVGYAGNEALAAECLSIEQVEKDYILCALRDFDEVPLMLYTDEDVYTLAVLDGRAEDGELPADETLDAPESPEDTLETPDDTPEELPAEDDVPGIEEEPEAPVEELQAELEGEPQADEDESMLPEAEEVPGDEIAEVQPEDAPAAPESERTVVRVEPGDGSAPSRVRLTTVKEEANTAADAEIDDGGVAMPEDGENVSASETPSAADEAEPEPMPSSEPSPKGELDQPEAEPDAVPALGDGSEPEVITNDASDPEPLPSSEPSPKGELDQPEAEPDEVLALDDGSEPEMIADDASEPEPLPSSEPSPMGKVDQPEAEPDEVLALDDASEPEMIADDASEPEPMPFSEPSPMGKVDQPEAEPDEVPALDDGSEPEMIADDASEPEPMPSSEPSPMGKVDQPEAEPDEVPADDAPQEPISEGKPLDKETDRDEADPDQAEVEAEAAEIIASDAEIGVEADADLIVIAPLARPEAEAEAKAEAQAQTQSIGGMRKLKKAKVPAVNRSAASYDTALLRLSLTGDAEATATLRRVWPESESSQQVVEAYSLVSAEACTGITVTLLDAPELEAGEYLALYGLQNGELTPAPLQDYVVPGDSHAFSLSLYDGFALVRLGLTEYQRLEPVEAEDATIELSGLLPVDAGVEIVPVEGYDADPDGETLLAYDISVWTAEGESFQPDADQPIEVTVRSDAIRAALTEGGALKAYHYANGATEPEEVPILAAEGDAVTFAAAGFSVYTVVQVIKEKTVTASDGNTYLISVTYDSDSGVPMDAELEVSELLEGTEAYDSYVQKTAEALEKEVKHLAFAHAFDISLIDPATGAHCQPTKPVAVSIRLLRESIQQGDNVSVVHFPDSQTENPSEMGGMDTENPSEGEILGVNVNGETVEFESTGFSVYVVAKEDKIQKYVFHNYDSAGNLYIFSEQALITGESLVRPSDPTKAGAVFDHWATEKNGAAAVDFSAYNPITVDDTKTQEQLDAAPVNFYAVYGAAKTVVVFYNQSGLVVEKVERDKPAVGESAVTLDTNDVSYTPIQDKEGAVLGFNYWTTDAHGTGAEVQLGEGAAAGEIKITAASPDTIELYPNLSEGHYIYFDGNKDSYSGISSVPYTGPVFVPNENNAAASATAAVNSLNARTDSYGIPVVDGYVFKGWYIDVSDANDATTDPVFEPDGAGRMKVNQEEFNLLLNNFENLPNNPTLYAHWTPKTDSKYTVVLWTQKLSDDGKTAIDDYAFQGSFEYTATTGATKTVANANADAKAKSGTNNNYDFTGLSELAMYNRVFAPNPQVSEKEENPFYGFTYIADKSDISETVKPDGSTVLNIRYNRNLHNISFVVPKYTRINRYANGCYGYVDGVGYVVLYRSGIRYYFNYGGTAYRYDQYGNGYYYSRTDSTVKAITIPFGATIIDEFSFVGNDSVTYSGVSWYPVGDGDQKYKVELMALQSMPDESYVFTYNSTGKGKYMHYYVEASGAADEEGRTRMRFPETGNDYKWYVEYSTIEHNYPILLFTEDVTEIDGYIKDRLKANPQFTEYNSQYGGYAVTPETHSYFFYDRQTYSIRYYDPAESLTNPVYTDNSVKFKAAMSEATSAYTPTRSGYLFTGWYMDSACKIKLCTTQAEYDAYTPNTAAGESKELMITMPSRNVQLYAGWQAVKNHVTLVPGGGEMDEQGTNFNLDPGEKINLSAEPTRDYVAVAQGSGKYVYDPINGHYTEAAVVTDGEYIQKPGAYIFLGWYYGEYSSPYKTVEYKAGQYTYAYGDYEDVGEGNGVFNKAGEEYTFVGEGNGQYNFVFAQPDSVTDTAFAPNALVTKPVTLVAKWMRAGGFYVRYNTVDVNLGNAAVTAPTDDNEYIEGAHAVVLAPVTAPKGYSLDYWKGPVTTEHPDGKYYPNQLVTISDATATTETSGETVVWLTAVYRPFDPSERTMANYTFMVDDNHDGDFEDANDTYEVERIAVNEELKPPVTPPGYTKDGHTYSFKGWFYDPAGAKPFEGFGVITNPVYTTLYAVFEEVYTVNYHLTDVRYLTDSSIDGPTATVLATQTYKQGEDLDTRRVDHPVDLDHYVLYWVSDWANRADAATHYDYKTMTNKAFGTDITGDLNLYAVLKERNNVNFVTGCDTYVPQQEIQDGSWPVRPDTPKRPGYTFLGWYTTETGGSTPYDFHSVLPEGVNTLYARWESDGSLSSDFTIIWWAETAEGNGNYEFQKSAMATGTVGVVTNTANFLAANPTYDDTDNLVVIDAEKRPYFEYNSTESDSSFVVEADGSTVLNLRFTRIRYTYRFDPGTLAKIVYNGHEYTNATNNRYEFEVWLDKEIASQWPMVDNTRNPHIAITDSSGTGVTWHVGSRDIFAVETSASTDRLQNADSNRVVEFTASKDTTSQTTIIRYYLGESEAADFRSVIKRDISPVSTTYNGLQYNRTFLAKTITGYHPIVITDGDTPIVPNGYLVRGKDVGASETDTTNYNRIYGRYDAVTSTGTEEYQVTLYSYARKDNVQYYVWVSQWGFDAFYPVNITFHNDRETKDSYEVTYTDRNGNTHAVTGGTIYYVANGAEPYRIVLGPLARTNTTAITWDNFVHNAIQESTQTVTRTRPVATGKIKYVTFYYARNIYTVNLLNGTTPYGSVDVEYERYVPEALAEAGITDPVSTQEGMTFAGWSITEDTVEPYNHNMPAYNLTLYATWKPVEYTVTTLGVDINGNGFTCDEQGREIDANGNLVPNGKVSATYTARYNQQLRELEIPNPTATGKLFMGWKTVPEATGEESVSISGNYRIIRNLRIEPTWNELHTRQVVYDANVPKDPVTNEELPHTGTAPADNNSYTVGGKLVIKGTDLSVTRKDVKGNDYTAPFAYWNTKADGSGEKYYPGTTVTVKESGPDTLTLYAVYSEYRETVLTYDKNADDAAFKQAGDDWTATDTPYSPLTTGGQVEVLYRDKRSTGFVPGQDMIPNQTFPIGQDQEGSHFTVARTDNLGNSYLFAGWSTDQAASVAMAKNGDKAYVNTITVKEMVNGTEKEVLHNTLYAVWGICKIVDKNGTEHVFDTLQKAVSFISTSDLITNKTATIEMLIDYNKPSSDAVTIPADCTVTLTTARTGTLRYNGTTNSVITRAQDGASMLENNGTLTLTDITLDGASGTYTLPTEGGIIKTNANSTLNVNGGTTIRNSKAEKGGGIYVLNGATATVTEASFSNCEATVDGGAIYVYTSGSLTVNGGTSFTSCKAIGGLNNSTSYGDGGAIFSEGTLNLLGTEGKHITFTHCTTMRDGGGVRLNDANYDVRIEYCDFETCSTTATDGGAMFLVGKSLAISNCDIQNCTAGWQGGGILIQTGNASTTNTTLTDITVKGCSAQNGGGIYVHTGNIALTGGTIEDCRATGTGDYGNGGAIFLSGGAKITENGLLIDGHSSLVLTDNDETNKTQASGATANAVRGGGIYVDSGAQFTFTGGELIKLKASGDGGAIYNKGAIVMTEKPENSGSTHVLTNGSIEYCSATNGGAIYNVGGTAAVTDSEGNIATPTVFGLTMTGGYIEHCMATRGGGIYNAGYMTMSADGDHPGVISDCSATNGGGIDVASGELDMNGGVIQGCTATDGGGIYLGNGTLKLDGGAGHPGMIDACTATNNGGGIYLGAVNTNNVTIEITGGTIQNCTAGEKGGAIYDNSQASIKLESVTINGHQNLSKVPEATTNAKQGGGIYLPNWTNNFTSSLTMKDCYIYNLTANQGGTIFSDRRSLDPTTGEPTEEPDETKGVNIVISGGVINGHYDAFSNSAEANAGNGGMLYLGNGSVNISGTNISNCTVAGDGNDRNNLTAGSGGVIFNVGNGHPNNDKVSPTVTLSNVTIDGGGLTNAQNGGAIFMKMAVLKMTNCTLQNLKVESVSGKGGKGAALYGTTNDGGNTNSDFTIIGGKIENNTASGTNGGAINVVSGKTVKPGANNAKSSIVKFEGDAVVYNNKNNGNQANMVLEKDDLGNNNAVIQTTATGLGPNARIGVYVAGDAVTDPYQNHGTYALPFGTWASSANLEKFTSDRDESLVGMIAVDLGKATDNLIYWGRYLCKIVDSNKVEHVFPTLNKALAHSRANVADYVSPGEGKPAVCTIQMLMDYAIPGGENAEGGDVVELYGTKPDNILITTAAIESKLPAGEKYAFKATFTEADGRAASDSAEKAILKRGTNHTGSMFTVGSGADFATKDIILDGGAVFDDAHEHQSGQVSVDGGIISVAANGKLTVDGGSKFQNTKSSKTGGAIYVAKNGAFSITGTSANGVEFTNCIGTGGGAVNIGDDTSDHTVNINYCTFSYCQATGGDNESGAGGALRCYAKNLKLENCDFEYCKTKNSGQGGGLYHKGDTSFEATSCIFTSCIIIKENANQAAAGALETQAKSVTVDDCTFTDCTSTKNAGAMNVYKGGSTILVKNSTFTRCKTTGTGSGDYGNGGALRTTGSSTTVENCTFTDCEAKQRGGAIHCKTNTTIKGTTIIDTCKAIDVGGGAVYLEGGTLIIEAGTIQNCIAPDGGAVYQAGTPICKFQGGTISNCVATHVATGNDLKHGGGGIFLNGGTFNLEGGSISECKAVGYGGGIYLGGGTFTFTSGSISQSKAKAGGGIYANTDQTVTISASGNAITNCEARDITVTNGTVDPIPTTFSSDNKGGGIYQAGGTLNITNAMIGSCKANNGGGIYLGSGTLAVNNGVTVKSSVAGADTDGNGGYGGGIYLGVSGNKKSVLTLSGMIGGTGTGDGNSAVDGAGIYQADGELTVNSNAGIKGNAATGNGGGIYLGGKNSKLTLNGVVGGSGTSEGNSAVNGGGIFQAGGNLTISDGVSIIGNSATGGNGGGIYLDQPSGTTTKLTLDGGTIIKNTATAVSGTGGNGGGIYLNAGTFTFNAGTVGDTRAEGNQAVNGAGVYQGGGTLNMNGGIVNGNAATGDGGGIYLGGGEFTLNDGVVGISNDSETGEVTYDDSEDGNSAVNGGGLYVADGVEVHILGGKISGNRVSGLGGGIMPGGPAAKTFFAGSIQVFDNFLEATGTQTEGSRCDVCLAYESTDHEGNGIINTTSAGLNELSHIGVYVIDELFEDHGKAGKPFGTFVSDASLNRFINNRSGDKYQYYEYYYGVRRPDHQSNIYWASYICEITDASGNLLFTNGRGTAPALYEFLGKQGAFEALSKNTTLYTYNRVTKTSTVYTGDLFVKMLVNKYSLQWSGTVQVPTMNSRKITLTMCDVTDGNFSDDEDAYTGYCVINRGVCTTSMFTTSPGSDFTITNIWLDGGCYNETDDEYNNSAKSVDGGLINAKGNLTLGNNAVLKNSEVSSNKQGGAIYYSGSGTFTMNSGSTIEHCKAPNGGVLSVNASGETVNFVMNTGAVINKCTGTNGLIYVKSGTLNVNSDLDGTAGTGNIRSCTSTNGGLAYMAGGTLNLKEEVSNFNHATHGGAVYTNGGTLNLTGSITNCSVANNGNGGGVYLGNSGTMNLDGEISGCTAANGGGVHVNKATLKMEKSSSVIENCTAGKGGAIFVTNGDSVVQISDGEISGNKANGANTGGGAIRIESGSVTISGDALIDGNYTEGNNNKYGGAVSLKGGSLEVSGGTFSNNEAKGNALAYGGAIYVSGGAELTVSAGTFTKNTAKTDGAAIYLASDQGGNGILNLSGEPEFGTGANANTVTKTGYEENKTNGWQDGDEVYQGDKVRQDIFIAENSGTTPQSITVNGELTGEPGTIWVWAEQPAHYQQLMPFAKLGKFCFNQDADKNLLDKDGNVTTDITKAVLQAGYSANDNAKIERTLSVFRNAQDDDITENATDTWLKGTIEGDTVGYVYWTGIAGSRKVILRKVDSNYTPVNGKMFTVYKGASGTAYTPKGETDALSSLQSYSSGVFYIGTLPYGTYYIEESDPDKWFYLIIDETEIYCSLDASNQAKVGGYDSRDDATDAATAKNTALKADKSGT